MARGYSSDCHTFYIIYSKDEEKFWKDIFLRENDAINYCNRWHCSNLSYMKVEMPRDFRKLKFEGVDYAKVYKVR